MFSAQGKNSFEYVGYVASAKPVLAVIAVNGGTQAVVFP